MKMEEINKRFMGIKKYLEKQIKICEKDKSHISCSICVWCGEEIKELNLMGIK